LRIASQLKRNLYLYRIVESDVCSWIRARNRVPTRIDKLFARLCGLSCSDMVPKKGLESSPALIAGGTTLSLRGEFHKFLAISPKLQPALRRKNEILGHLQKHLHPHFKDANHDRYLIENIGGPGGIRTPNQGIMSPLL